jgi:protein SCO1/2
MMSILKAARGLMQSSTLVLLLLVARVQADDGGLPPALRGVAIDQRLDEQVPLDLVFRSETGDSVLLADLIHNKPVILVLAYYRCPMLCTLTLNGLVEALERLSFNVGEDFSIITVSFDPRETPEMAAAKKQSYIERYGRPNAAAGWHFLTGDKTAIGRLTASVGFRYAYDPKLDQYAHGSGIIVLTPQGRTARYFLGVQYSPRDLRFALVEASAGRIGSPIDQVMLFCYQYDSTTGKYTAVALNVIRLGALVTIVVLAFFVFWLWRRERRGLFLLTQRAKSRA